MRVVRGYHDLAPHDRGASAALGNFDGLHKGHRRLIGAAQAAHPEAPAAVVSFEPHPRRHFQPEAPPFRLCRPEERARVLARLGLARIHEIPFDETLSVMSAEAFAEDVLHRGLGLVHVVVGADFRFGRARRGDPGLLERLGKTLGFGVTVAAMDPGPDGHYSSTAIRRLITEGDMHAAALALGRWHTVSGPVIQGDQRGRDLGYPTANLAFGEQLKPRHGVYAARVRLHDGPHRGLHDGVANIGVRPQFGVNAPNFEVHLFDFKGDLYGTEISVDLVAHLRDEARFDGVEALIIQMDADSAAARAILAKSSADGPE
ncbi:MAG: bifunctional riboflavin kinase/FAD synthetase [Pseudomonadota bacterium]